jgi:hypothetical protein
MHDDLLRYGGFSVQGPEKRTCEKLEKAFIETVYYGAKRGVTVKKLFQLWRFS